MNCLAYALRFWEEQPDYKLFYNSGHVINMPITNQSYYFYDLFVVTGFLPAEDYGYCYFSSAFEGLLDEHEQELLKKYFNEGVV